MTNTITALYPRLASLHEVMELITASFQHDAPAILQGMKAGADLGCDGEEVEALITEFVLDHAVVVTSYKGLGTSDNSSSGAMAYFEANHPEAHHLLHAQTQEMEKLLGKDGAAVALGQAREPFTIDILHWGSVYVVTAEDFEDAWFDDEGAAISYAQHNYEPFIKNAERSKKPDRTI